MSRNLAILIFNDAEVLDFCGPFEVFNVANEVSGKQLFNVSIVAESCDQINARNNLKVIPDYSISNCPEPDILLIPGGIGSRVVLKNEAVMNWVRKLSQTVELLLSVCTGAMILAEAGLLDGLKATTHHSDFDELAQRVPKAEIIENVKYVDNGKIILAGGISAGINMSLYVLTKLAGKEIAIETAREMEYDWAPNKNPN